MKNENKTEFYGNDPCKIPRDVVKYKVSHIFIL